MQLVLDTNVVLDLFLFGDAAARPVANGLEQGALHWLATAAMREELARVLAYPKLASRVAGHPGGAGGVLAAFDRHARLVQAPAKAAVTCGDPDDQKFIDLAVAHRCTLISKDREVLRTKKRLAQLQVLATGSWGGEVTFGSACFLRAGAAIALNPDPTAGAMVAPIQPSLTTMSDITLLDAPSTGQPQASADQPACDECVGSGGWFRYEPASESAAGPLYLSCVQCRGSGRTAFPRD